MTDADVLALTLYGEARGEPIEGRIAVACCIRNRVTADLGHDGKPDWWGEGYTGVCLAPKQFSCWNANDPNLAVLQQKAGEFGRDPLLDECRWIANGVIDGVVRDRVGPATHYYEQHMRTPPKWAAGATLVARVSNHLFFMDVK